METSLAVVLEKLQKCYEIPVTPSQNYFINVLLSLTGLI